MKIGQHFPNIFRSVRNSASRFHIESNHIVFNIHRPNLSMASWKHFQRISKHSNIYVYGPYECSMLLYSLYLLVYVGNRLRLGQDNSWPKLNCWQTFWPTFSHSLKQFVCICQYTQVQVLLRILLGTLVYKNCNDVYFRTVLIFWRFNIFF